MSEHTHTVLTEGCYRCELNRDEIRDAEPPTDRLERARAWLERNTKIRWATKSEHGITPSELNRRPERYAAWMQGFSDEESAKDVEAALDEFVLELYEQLKPWRLSKTTVIGAIERTTKRMKEAYERRKT